MSPSAAEVAAALLEYSVVNRLGLAALIAACCAACAPAVRRTIDHEPTAAELAEFWIDPGRQARDLLRGPGDHETPPEVDASYDVLSRDTRGFSITYKVRDANGRVWHVKIGPEAQPEVVSSRIVWALGYHQLPAYFVERWIAVDRGIRKHHDRKAEPDAEDGQQKHDRATEPDQTRSTRSAKGALLGGARFRPDDLGLTSHGTWSWQQNPFVGTRPYRGLLAVMMILNSTDLKNDNNGLYDVDGRPREGARRWYVVKDLGATLGETGRMDPRRGNIGAFEREPFIVGVHGGNVWFGYRGRHAELLAHISPADVRWACERLDRVTDAQWRDAFRAGGYDAETTTRYVTRIKDKIRQGLALDEKGTDR